MLALSIPNEQSGRASRVQFPGRDSRDPAPRTGRGCLGRWS